MDLQGYFISLPREKLCRKILKDIDKQFEPYWERGAARALYALCKFLWESVILDDPVKKARKRGALSNWDPEVLPKNKSLREELELTLHPKKRYMQSVYKGMPYLGARIYPRCLYPSDRTQAKFWKAVRDYDSGVGKAESVISYLGHMKHLDRVQL